MMKESSIWDNDNKVGVEVKGTFRLFLKTYCLDCADISKIAIVTNVGKGGKRFR